MFIIVLGAVTAFFLLPCCAQLLASFGPKHFVDSLDHGIVFSVPSMGGGTLDNAVCVASEAYGTTGKRGAGVVKGFLFLAESSVWRSWGRAL